MKIAIYTAIIGNYDELKEPTPQDVECDFLCFSDSMLPKRYNGWQIIHVQRDESMHPRMQAKYFKLMNHRIFPGGRLSWKFALQSWKLLQRKRYEVTIWCDGSLQIKSESFARDVANTFQDSSVAVFVHPDRDCIFDEVQASIPMKKYANLPLSEQVQYYKNFGTPTNCGLFACGVIGRKAPNSHDTIKFEEEWWEENLRWTYQDQLSFAHLVYQKQIPVSIIPGNLWSNKYFDVLQHTSEE
jgi:O-antigen biosynthesis protein